MLMVFKFNRQKAVMLSILKKIRGRLLRWVRTIKNELFRPEASLVEKSVIGTDNTVVYAGSELKGVKFDINGSDNEILIQEGCYLNNVSFHIRGNGHKILIDEAVRFNGGGSIWIEDTEGFLSIGKKTTFENVHLSITEPKSKLTIGEDCMLAYDIDIRTGDSHSIISSETGERLNYAKNIIIGDHVWVAAHSCLLKGTVIGSNSVVATGSIVTGEFPDLNVIIGGSPAKIIKRGVTWDRRRIFREDGGSRCS